MSAPAPWDAPARPAARSVSVAAPFGTLAATLHPARRGPVGAVLLWPSIFSTAAVQHDLTARLARDHHVLAVDPPGHGASRIVDARALSMPVIADATLALARGEGLSGPLRWIGTSWGGLVGIEVARTAPDRLAHLALLNVPFAWEGPGWGKPRLLPLLARTMGRTKIFADGVAGDFFLPGTRTDPARAQAMAAHRATFAGSEARQLSAAARLIFRRRTDARPALAGLRVPVLVVAGRHDPTSPMGMQRAAAATIPGAVFRTVESRHVSAVDAPAEIERLLRLAWGTA